MAFWKRKKPEDRFVTLGLGGPPSSTTAAADEDGKIPKPPSEEPRASTAAEVSPATGEDQKASAGVEAPGKTSAWQTSVLGLDLSIEDLQAREAALEQEFSARFRRAVTATRESLSEKIDSVFASAKQIDASLLDELEEALIAADIGVPTTMHVLETVRRGISRKEINDIDALKQAIKTQLLSILHASEANGVATEAGVPEDVAPYVMMIVGVNGVGKTTTIGKLAQRIKARGTDVLIVDTAGRLHNKANLMAELEKMKRVAGREVQGAPHETLLVVDAVTGQNGLEQARQFLKVAGVTGIVLTKLDGTAKGGIAVAIAKELGLPIRYAGIGEKLDDLVVFDPEQYVNSLFN